MNVLLSSVDRLAFSGAKHTPSLMQICVVRMKVVLLEYASSLSVKVISHWSKSRVVSVWLISLKIVSSTIGSMLTPPFVSAADEMGNNDMASSIAKTALVLIIPSPTVHPPPSGCFLFPFL